MAMVSVRNSQSKLGPERIFARCITALVPLHFFYLFAGNISFDIASYGFANTLGPLWLIFVLSLTSFYLLKLNVRLVWTPLFWLPAQSAIFFGLGPLVYVLGNALTQAELGHSILSVTEAELLWANQMSTVGVWCLLLGVYLHLVMARRSWRELHERKPRRRTPLSPDQVAWFLVIFGGALKYGFALPALWGQLNLLVPGFLTTVTGLLDVGFAIMAFRSAQGNSSMRIGLVLLLPLHVALSMLTFSKEQIIIALLMPALGDLLGRQRLPRFFLFMIAVAVIYTFSQDLVEHGRGRIFAETGTITSAGYVERFDITISFFGSKHEIEKNLPGVRSEELQNWWTRLNYSGAQVAARKLRDRGVPNHSLSGAWMYFIPRAVWPGKPIIIGPGWYLYEMLTGNEGTFLGLSIYGDLFWFGGWWATALFSSAIGFLFSIASLRSVRLIRDLDFISFPLVLIPMRASIFGPTNFVANGIISVIPMYVAYSIMVFFFVRFLRALPKRPRRSIQGNVNRQVPSSGDRWRN